MALSRLAEEFAAEIKLQDWSDAPYRLDRAGHDRKIDTKRGPEQLNQIQTSHVRTNAMWVVAQVLAYEDPNFDVYEFADACGVETRTQYGQKDGAISAGLRKDGGLYHRPGTYSTEPSKD